MNYICLKAYCIHCNKVRTIIVRSVELDGTTKEEILIGHCEVCGKKVRSVKKI